MSHSGWRSAQELEAGRLDGGGELHHVVPERHRLELGDAEIAGGDELGGEAEPRIGRGLVAEHDIARARGVMAQERGHQHARIGEIIVGDDGEEDGPRVAIAAILLRTGRA